MNEPSSECDEPKDKDFGSVDFASFISFISYAHHSNFVR